MTNKPVRLHTQRVVLYNYFCSQSRCCSSGCPHVLARPMLFLGLSSLCKLMLFSGLPQTVPLFLSVLGCCVHTSLQMLSTFYGVAAYCIIGGLQQLDIQMFFAALVVVSLSSCTSPIHCSMVCCWSAVVRTPHCRCCVDVVQCSCLSHHWWLTTASQRLCTRGWFPLYILPHKLFKTLTCLLCVITDFTAPFVPKCQVLRSHVVVWDVSLQRREECRGTGIQQ